MKIYVFVEMAPKNPFKISAIVSAWSRARLVVDGFRDMHDSHSMHTFSMAGTRCEGLHRLSLYCREHREISESITKNKNRNKKNIRNIAFEYLAVFHQPLIEHRAK